MFLGWFDPSAAMKFSLVAALIVVLAVAHGESRFHSLQRNSIWSRFWALHIFPAHENLLCLTFKQLKLTLNWFEQGGIFKDLDLVHQMSANQTVSTCAWTPHPPHCLWIMQIITVSGFALKTISRPLHACRRRVHDTGEAWRPVRSGQAHTAHHGHVGQHHQRNPGHGEAGEGSGGDQRCPVSTSNTPTWTTCSAFSPSRLFHGHHLLFLSSQSELQAEGNWMNSEQK